MTNANEPAAKPEASFRLVKQENGSWWFQLTWRGVTQPLAGPFRSQIDAAGAAQQAARAFAARVKS